MTKHDPQSDPRGVYGVSGWKDVIEDDESQKYDHVRFGRSARGRRMQRRERAMVDRFLASLPASQTVLDAPSGIGRFTDLVTGRGHRPLAADLNFVRVRDTRRVDDSVVALQADVMYLPLRDDAVGAAICFRLLHHLAPELVVAVLRELRRVASCAYVTFYCTATWKYHKKRVRGKVPRGKYYSRRQMHEMCRAAGWEKCEDEGRWDILHTLHGLRLSR